MNRQEYNEMRKKYNALIKQMAAEVDKTVKYYRSDFDGQTDYSDKARLMQIYRDTESKERELVWSVRECGTDLGFVSSLADCKSWISACANASGRKWYLLDLKQGKLFKIKDIRKFAEIVRREYKAA